MKSMRNPKRKPTHPGETLREDVLPALEMTQGEFAKRLGVSRLTVSELLHGKRALSPDMAAARENTTINFDEVDVRSQLLELTGGRGPEKCIDAVGMEASHGAAHIHAYDRVKQAVRAETERPHALRQAIMACRSGGVVSVIGVYGGFLDKFPAGAWMNR